MFCPNCSAPNPDTATSCVACGTPLAAQRTPGDSGRRAKFATASFALSLLGWVLTVILLVIAAIIGNKPGQEPHPAVAVVFLLLMVVTGLLFIAGVVFGVMGMKADNTINRWQGITGFVLSLAGGLSVGCCMLVALIGGLAAVGRRGF